VGMEIMEVMAVMIILGTVDMETMVNISINLFGLWVIVVSSCYLSRTQKIIHTVSVVD
jgi:hypothetical protein